MPDTATTQLPTERERYIAVLGAIADLLREHPEIPEPSIHSSSVQFCVFGGDVLGIAATLRHVIGGKWGKEPSGEKFFHLTGEWHGYEVVVSVYREVVCRKVVKGTELRPVEKITQAAVTETVMEAAEIIEWDCGSLLAPRPGDPALDA